MKKLLPLLVLISSLTACSSHQQTPVMAQFEPQYCHTKSNTTLTNGSTVSSQTDITCTDDPKDKHFLAYSGIAETCREHYYYVWYNGQKHRQRGYVCQRPDGRWEVLNHPFR